MFSCSQPAGKNLFKNMSKEDLRVPDGIDSEFVKNQAKGILREQYSEEIIDTLVENGLNFRSINERLQDLGASIHTEGITEEESQKMRREWIENNIRRENK